MNAHYAHMVGINTVDKQLAVKITSNSNLESSILLDVIEISSNYFETNGDIHMILHTKHLAYRNTATLHSTI